MHGSLEADGERSELSFDGVIGKLGPKVIVYDGPAGDGPAIVDLPD